MKPQFEPEKLAELILYIADKCRADPRFGAVKLNKILFYSDFTAYRELHRAITGAEYQHLGEGPAPRQLQPIRRKLESEDAAYVEPRPYFNRIQERLIPKRPAQKIFTPEELAIVDRVIDELWESDGEDVTKKSHHEPGWKLTDDGETIPYSSAWFSSKPLSAKQIKLGKKVAEKHNLRSR
jgi:hypothetical protein